MSDENKKGVWRTMPNGAKVFIEDGQDLSEAFRTRSRELNKTKFNYKNGAKYGKINIEIDELTPCLKRLSDGAVVETSMKEINPRKSEFKDWIFDWSEEKKRSDGIIALFAKGDSRIQGLVSYKDDKQSQALYLSLAEAAPQNQKFKYGTKEYGGVGGHLFAEVCRLSKEKGYGGFIYFDSKTELINYYQEELGALRIGKSNRMLIEEGKANELIEKYYGQKEKERF